MRYTKDATHEYKNNRLERAAHDVPHTKNVLQNKISSHEPRKWNELKTWDDVSGNTATYGLPVKLQVLRVILGMTLYFWKVHLKQCNSHQT